MGFGQMLGTNFTLKIKMLNLVYGERCSLLRNYSIFVEENIVLHLTIISYYIKSRKSQSSTFPSVIFISIIHQTISQKNSNYLP